MRHRKLLISCTPFIAAAAVAGLVPHTPMLSLSVSRIEAMEVSQKDGKALENWAVTIGVTNVSSDWITLDNHKIEVAAKVANRWVVAERPDFWASMSSGADGELTLLVPTRAEACRVSLGYAPGWPSDSIECFLRFNPVCQRFLPSVCDWAADHTPKLWRHVTFQLTLPKAPTWASPKVSGAHNPRSSADAGFAICLQFGRRWSGAADSER